MKHDNIYMRRAIELAQLGQGKTRPNPMVGALLVCQGRIIGEGYHHEWGKPHAEVMAVGSVRPDDRPLLKECTLYVSLEPCSHHGKTPPCADLIVREGIPRVVVAQLDPYPEVAGRGIERLRRAGVEVVVGVEEGEARRLNSAFNSVHSFGRPYTLLKWAESADGYMDAARGIGEGLPFVFSSPYRQRLVHRTRRNYQAILVGARTALQDNPSLTNRYWLREAQPIRIVLDWSLSLPSDLRLFTDATSPTWVIYDKTLVATKPEDSGHIHYYGIACEAGRAALQVQELLQSKGINSLMVEGGSKTLQSFIDSEAYDEIRCERSRLPLGDGVASPRL